MYKVRTYNNISRQGLDRFSSSNYVVDAQVDQPDAVILRSHSLHNETLPDSVLAVARAGAGTNNIPIDNYIKKGIVVFNTPGANANAVKELVLSGMLVASRNITEGVNFVRQLDSSQDYPDKQSLNNFLESQKKKFVGSELYGKTLGIVGLGSIGSMLANIAEQLGMQVLGYDPAISIEAAWKLSSRVVKMDSLESLLKASDFVSLHVPAIDATHHLINADNCTLFKPNAVLLNFARAQIVDADAIYAALNAGNLAHYVTDFPTPDMLSMDKVLPMPHIGASTEEAETNCAIMAVDQLKDFLENGNIVNSINFPTTVLNRVGVCRLAIINRNEPSMLSKIMDAIKDINVLELLNKSKAGIAYNLIDLEHQPKAELINSISQIDGIISLRVIC